MSHDLEWWKMYLLDQVGVIRTTHKHCCCSVAKSCLTFCDPMDCNPPGFPVLHYLLEFAQTHARWAVMSLQLYHLCHLFLLLLTIFPSIRVFSNESAINFRWPKYWSFSFSVSPSREYSGLISFRIHWFWSLCCPRDSQESSSASQCENINSLLLSLLYGPTPTSVRDHWKNHSFEYMNFYWQSNVSAF